MYSDPQERDFTDTWAFQNAQAELIDQVIALLPLADMIEAFKNRHFDMSHMEDAFHSTLHDMRTDAAADAGDDLEGDVFGDIDEIIKGARKWAAHLERNRAMAARRAYFEFGIRYGPKAIIARYEDAFKGVAA